MNNAIKLARFFEEELASSLGEVVLSKDKLGKYLLFGNYLVVPTNGGFYKVLSTKHEAPLEFSSLKNATSWCVLHNSGNYHGANRIQSLDLKLCSTNIDLAIHKKLAKVASSAFNKEIYTVKLQEDAYKRRIILQEINNYINTSKTIQESNFRKKDPNFNYR